MSALSNPCYVFAPRNILRRLWFQALGRKQGKTVVNLAWGTPIEVDLSDTIGREIYKQRVFDLAVSECAWRIIQEGDQILDAGANIGYMTNLFARRAGPSGRVHAFEPHPALRASLENNAGRIARAGRSAPVVVHACALGAATGVGDLVEADQFNSNCGTATLQTEGAREASSRRHRVEIQTLDALLNEGSFGLLKIDVEGHELEVLRGAQRLLRERRCRNIIYEDHSLGEGELPHLLRAAGYAVVSIGYSLRRLELKPLDQRIALDTSWQSASYLATLDPEALRACEAFGWQVLRG